MTVQPDPQAGKKSPLLTTKLHIPSPHHSLVPRPRLVEQLNQVLNFKLVLVSAPAGYGKTTLLTQWLSGEGADKFRDRAAWVSLEDGQDLTRFWTYIFRALETRLPGTGEAAQAYTASPRPVIDAALSALINSISAISEEFLRILDDYETVEDQAVHDTLAFFLENLPDNLHLVIASRIDLPISLARLRLRGEMLELRAADLVFTPEEAASFLNRGMGLTLSSREIAALAKRTEGWIAGLHAAALSLQGRKDSTAFIQSFTGSQRYVMDFLVEEVL